jgi:folylpolyglutamate synthase/dihydrofolate synthase
VEKIMSNSTRKTINQPKIVVPGVQRNYNEVVEYLDSHWSISTNTDLHTMKALDKALGTPSKDIPAIIIAGTNGKGLTINYATILLQKEGLQVGAFYSPRILTYNEQFSYNNESISNKTFTELANDIINTAEANAIKASSREILAAMAFMYFKQNNADVTLLEVSDSAYDPFMLCDPKIVAITRITDEGKPSQPKSSENIIKELLSLIKPETHVVSADQSKANLQIMLEEAERLGGTWAMPIRKLASLAYPFEQLHGRCAALAERTCQIFVEKFANKNALAIENSLLAKQKGQRGRPTLEAKRQAELNPKKTVDQFWKEVNTTLPAHFQILDKEKPTILLDNASDIDALKNLLLGIRLLHYQRPLKGITFVFGCDKNQMNPEEFLRVLRYFTKKNSAQVMLCPISNAIPGLTEESWDVEQITNDIKSLKIKARSTSTFQEAFEAAKQSVDERHGLVVITGSQSVIAQYWRYKGMKKL